MGDVITLEPVPETFQLLTANVASVGAGDVSLLGVAESSSSAHEGMSIPVLDSGDMSDYTASITDGVADVEAIYIPIDALSLDHPVSLVKINAKRHDCQALLGMRRLIGRDAPTIIIESGSVESSSFLESPGYQVSRPPGSPNRVFRIG